MGILDRKSAAPDESVGAVVPPVPPAPPVLSRQPTDAEVVATLARTLVGRLNELTDQLDKRLAAVSVPKDPQEPARDRPIQNLTAPYFASVCSDLETILAHIDRIEDALSRLAI